MIFWRSFGCAFFTLWHSVMNNKDKTAVFIGHSDCTLSIESVMPFVEREILNGVRLFLNGGQGAFDRIAARAVHNLKSKYSDINSTLVIPYHNFRVFDTTIFDEIINPNMPNSISYTGYKTAIPKRNKYMLVHSGTAICYISQISGGAYKTYQLAKRMELSIVNLYDELNNKKT